MKVIKRFYEDDLRQLVAVFLNVPVDQLTSVYTEETNGYGTGEHTEPIFYIEYEEKNDERNLDV
jgi:hypothetical protein